MKKAVLSFLFFVLLVLGLSLILPAEDFLDTAYGESEVLPYEETPLISVLVLRQAATSTTQAVSSLRGGPATPIGITARRANSTSADRCAGARVVLAFVCTLLC